MKATITLLAALALPVVSATALAAAPKEDTGAETKKPAKKPAGKSDDKAGAAKHGEKPSKEEAKHGEK
ncbi:MAG TPA: hypothetical protein VG963_01925 [Polyangiaceae bacterium]|nr:hypothetical protein [Polyangiaceae bacterium]